VNQYTVTANVRAAANALAASLSLAQYVDKRGADGGGLALCCHAAGKFKASILASLVSLPGFDSKRVDMNQDHRSATPLDFMSS
jgi:hypothetical protein